MPDWNIIQAVNDALRVEIGAPLERVYRGLCAACAKS